MGEVIGGMWTAAGGYAAIGVVLLIPFHLRALPAVDASTRGATWGFRVVVTPGLVALWPVIIWKWRAARRGETVAGRPDAPVSPRVIRRVHLLATIGLAIAVSVAAGAALWSRPTDAFPAGLEGTAASDDPRIP